MLQIELNPTTWLIGFIIIIVISVSITYGLRLTPRFMEDGSTGLLADWWRWINKSDHKQTIYAPKQTIDKHVESWSCPICGSHLTSSDVERLELGYNVQCEYCGATLGSSF